MPSSPSTLSAGGDPRLDLVDRFVDQAERGHAMPGLVVFCDLQLRPRILQRVQRIVPYAARGRRYTQPPAKLTRPIVTTAANWVKRRLANRDACLSIVSLLHTCTTMPERWQFVSPCPTGCLPTSRTASPSRYDPASEPNIASAETIISLSAPTAATACRSPVRPATRSTDPSPSAPW